MKQGQEFPLPTPRQLCGSFHRLPMMTFTHPFYPPTPSRRMDCPERRAILVVTPRSSSPSWTTTGGAGLGRRARWTWVRGKEEFLERKTRRGSATSSPFLTSSSRTPSPGTCVENESLRPSEKVARTKSGDVQGWRAECRVGKTPGTPCLKYDRHDSQHGVPRNPGVPQVSLRRSGRGFFSDCRSQCGCIFSYTCSNRSLVAVGRGGDTSSCCQGNVGRKGSSWRRR